MSTQHNSFWTRVQTRMNELGIGPSELARRSGVSLAQLRNYRVSGDQPQLRTLHRLAAALAVPAVALVPDSAAPAWSAMALVLVESPYAGDVERNVAYARAAMLDCFARHEAPFASHMLYTQPGVLLDSVPAERALGIEAGLAWGAKAAKTVVYCDLGVSPGMRQGIERAEREGRPVEYRSLPGWSR